MVSECFCGLPHETNKYKCISLTALMLQQHVSHVHTLGRGYRYLGSYDLAQMYM